MSTFTVLGVDPGTSVTGYGIVRSHSGVLQPLDFGCIRPKSSKLLSQKYLMIYNALSVLIEEHKPDALSVETQFVGRNVQSALKLGMARGMALLAAAQAGVAVYEYSPSRAKKAVVGTGRATKEQVQQMIQRHLHLSQLPEPEDAADALKLALCHIYAQRLPVAQVKET